MSFAARVLSHRRLRRRHFLVLSLLTLVICWVLWWLVTAHHFNKALERWIEQARANGIVIEYKEHYTNGSLFSIHTHFDGLQVKGRGKETVEAGESVFYLSLFNWGNVSAKLRHGVKGTLAGTTFAADSIKFGFSVPKENFNEAPESALNLWFHPILMTFNAQPPLLFGNRLEEALIDMSFLGAVPNFMDKDSIKSWTDLGGVVEFERLYMHWGTVVITATGTIGLDPNLQPEGAFSGRIEGIDSALSTLVQKGTIDKGKESLLYASLQVLSRPSGILGKSAPIVPISIQGGGVFLGPVKIMSVPEIKW